MTLAVEFAHNGVLFRHVHSADRVAVRDGGISGVAMIDLLRFFAADHGHDDH